MRTWQTQLAAALVWLGVLPGVLLLYVAYRAFANTDDMLLVVMPIIGTAGLVGGFVVIGGAATIAIGLYAGKPAARLQALMLGVLVGVCGLFALAASPLVALLLILYGGTLAWLMLSPAAASELGSFRGAVTRPVAPWGSAPGTRLWSDEAPQQGPWSAPPTTLPLLPLRQPSGPRTPWWELWRAGLAQGIPLWELVVLVVMAPVFGTGLVLVLTGTTGSATFGTLRLHGRAGVGLLLVALTVGVVGRLEVRMRRRLEGRAPRR